MRNPMRTVNLLKGVRTIRLAAPCRWSCPAANVGGGVRLGRVIGLASSRSYSNWNIDDSRSWSSVSSLEEMIKDLNSRGVLSDKNMRKAINSRLWSREIKARVLYLDSATESTDYWIPYSSRVNLSRVFKGPIDVQELELLTVSVMDLMVRFGYPAISRSDFAKANIRFRVEFEDGLETIKSPDVSAFSLFKEDGTLIPKYDMTGHICGILGEFQNDMFMYGPPDFIITECSVSIHLLSNITTLPLPLVTQQSRWEGLKECLYSPTLDQSHFERQFVYLVEKDPRESNPSFGDDS